MRHKAFLKGQSEVFFRLLGTLAGTVLLVSIILLINFIDAN